MDTNHPLLRIANGLSGGIIKSMSEAVELYGNMALTTNQNNELLQERIAELELDDVGYERLGGNDMQFSKAAINKIAQMARVYWLKNPLIKRACATQANYVLGYGVNVSAVEEDVQNIIDGFWKDERNRYELTGDQALLQKETELQVVGNLFFAFFVSPTNGACRVCTIPLNEIVEIVYNPEDAHEPWYYHRKWYQPKEVGSKKTEPHEAFYPDINFKPRGGVPKHFNGITVENVPIYHVKVNCLTDMDYGVSEIYAALDWAKAYKEFLEDWYTIVKSLSKFSWKATSKAGSLGFQQAQDTLKRAVNKVDGDLPGQSANVWMSTDNFDLSPMPKTGATVNVEDGRRALLMVCAATGIFEHYFGDPNTGNLATATTMEQPMLRMFTERQKLWEDIFRVILDFVIDKSAAAPAGKLTGTPKFDDYGEQYTELTIDRTFTVDFPPILEDDVNSRIDAIVKMTTLGGSQPAETVDLKTATREMLTALGEDTDIVNVLFPEDPKSWEQVKAENQEKALEIAQATQPKEEPEEQPQAEPEEEPEVAGEQEEKYIQVLDRMVQELRENG